MSPPSDEGASPLAALIQALESDGDWVPLLTRVQADLPGVTWAPDGDFVNDASQLRLSVRGICELLEAQRIAPAEAAALLRAVGASPPDAPDLELDADRWSPGSLLGVGGMGEVRAVEDRRLGRTVAHKRLHSTAGDHVRRFVQEARVTAQLEHPNIVPIYDLTVEDGVPVLAMRVVQGRSLRQVLDAGEMPAQARRLEVFKKVCDAMAYAHNQRVLHRDLKADNVMVGAFGEVQVMDWGLAWTDQSVEAPGTLAGTPATMAPEQARGDIDQLGPATDVYALGVLLYELVCDTRPFRGAATDVLADVRAGRFAPPRAHRPSLPRALDAIVQRAMALDPAARFESVAALRSDIEAFEQGLPIESLQYSPLARARLWLVRHRQRVVPVALTLGLAGALGLAGLTRYATDLGVARDEAMADRDRAVLAERTALERVVEAQLAGGRAALEGARWREARQRWTEARELGRELGLDTREADLGLAWAAHQAPPALHVWDGPYDALDATPGALILRGRDELEHIALPSGEVRGTRANPDAAEVAFLAGAPVLTRVRDGLRVESWEGSILYDLPADPGARAYPEGEQVVVRSEDELLVLTDRLTRVALPANQPGMVQFSGERLAIRNELGNDRVFDRAGNELARVERVPALVGLDWLVAEPGRLARVGVDGTRWDVPSSPVERAAVSPDGERIALLAYDPEVHVLDLASGELVARIPGGDTSSVSWAGADLLVTLDADGAAAAWPVPDRPAGQVTLPGQAVGMSLSPDGQRVAISGWGAEAWVVEVRSGRLLHRMRGPASGARDAQFSEDGKRVWLAGRDGAAWSFDAETGAPLGRVELDTLLTTVVEGPEGVVAVGSSGALLRPDAPSTPAHQGVIWELERDAESGRYLTTGRDQEDAHVRLWSPDLEPVVEIPVGGSAYRGDLDGERVAVGVHDGRVVIADLEGRVLLDIEAHKGPTMAVALQGQLLATTGYDLELHLYDSRSGDRLLSLQPFTQPGVDLEFSDDGRWLVALSGAGEMVLFDLHRADELERLAALGADGVSASLDLRGVRSASEQRPGTDGARP